MPLLLLRCLVELPLNSRSEPYLCWTLTGLQAMCGQAAGLRVPIVILKLQPTPLDGFSDEAGGIFRVLCPPTPEINGA